MHPKALLDHGADLLAQILTFSSPADGVVAQYCREQRSLGSRDRPFLADTVYRVLREKPLLEWLLQQHPLPALWPAKANSAGKGKSAPQSSRRVWGLLLLALRHDSEAWLSVLPTEVLAWLAACRQLEAQPPPGQPAACQHGLPAWLATALQVEVGDGFLALATALQQPAPLDVRVNVLKAKRQLVQEQLAAAGVSSTPTPYSPWGLRLDSKLSLQSLSVYREGQIEIQDEGSQLLALLLEAKRQELVLDFCAGAGGKTLALGAMMRDTGRLYALDNSAHRLQGLTPRLQRSGLSNVHPMAIAHENDARLQRLQGKMDRVLVDAPCSGLGTLRRSPDLKWRQTAADIEAIAAVQTRILDSAARLLKPGGRLVYATCSLLRQENEAVAEAFSAAQRDFVLLPALQVLQHAGISNPEDLVRGDYLRLWPHRHGTDGFFAAVWQRKA